MFLALVIHPYNTSDPTTPIAINLLVRPQPFCLLYEGQRCHLKIRVVAVNSITETILAPMDGPERYYPSDPIDPKSSSFFA